jgi:hypothetical protein
MHTDPLGASLARLFAELVNGAPQGADAFILNSGDAGLLGSLEKLSADDASQSVSKGATIAAHAQHVQYGLSLMNRWAREGGNPFADAKWEQAWNTSRVDDSEWRSIQDGSRSARAVPKKGRSVESAGPVAGGAVWRPSGRDVCGAWARSECRMTSSMLGSGAVQSTPQTRRTVLRR